MPIEPLLATRHETGTDVGLDVGLKVFLVTADGEVVEHPRHHCTAERPLARMQRRVSRRRTKGSRRRRKAVTLLTCTYRRVQRRDVHHQTALTLLRPCDALYLEDVPVRHRVRNYYLAKGLSDAGWAQFRTILDATAACAGRQVIAVAAQYTSQDGSGALPDRSRCRQQVAKSLSVRTQVCPSCGWVLDRDEHAAPSSLQAGQARQALTWPVAASVA